MAGGLAAAALLLCTYGVLNMGATVRAAVVSEVANRVGSVKGGTSVTIKGTGFSTKFSLSDPNIGNKVTMVSATKSFMTDGVENSRTKTSFEVVTKPMPADTYDVYVTVDGVEVGNGTRCASDKSKCRFETQDGVLCQVRERKKNLMATDVSETFSHTATPERTPTVGRVSPTSGPAGTMVNVTGRIITQKTSSNEQANTAKSITRVTTNAGTCNIRDASANVYGIGLENAESENGYFLCKLDTNYVGPINISFTVQPDYGKSKADRDTLQMTPQNRIAMFSLYAEISSISPNIGGLNGGTTVTINGTSLNNTAVPPEVYIGDQPGHNVTILSMEQISFSTPVKPPSSSLFTGNRGMKKLSWVGGDYDNVATLTSNSPGYKVSYVNDTGITETISSASVSRTIGFYKPVINGSYVFSIKCDRRCDAYLSTDASSANAVQIAGSNTPAPTYTTSSSQKSSKQNLKAGMKYYLEIRHEAQDESSFVHLKVKLNESRSTADMSGAGVNAKQDLVFNSTHSDDVQEIRINGCDTTDDAHTTEIQKVVLSGISNENTGHFYRLRLFNASTEKLRVGERATQVAAAINKIGTIKDTLKVTVTEVDSTTEKEFIFTFTEVLGDVPPIEVILVEPCCNATKVNYTVTEVKKGVPSRKYYRLEMNGKWSSPLTCGSTADEVKGAVLSLFSALCRPEYTEKGTARFNENYEEDGNDHDVEPFCGHFTKKEPPHLYSETSTGTALSQVQFLCLAHMGSISNTLTITFKFDETDSEKKKHTRQRQREYTFEELVPSDGWQHTCVNIKDPIINSVPNTGNNPTNFYILKIQSHNDGDKPVYIDVVRLTPASIDQVSKEDLLIEKRGPVLINGNTVNVVSVSMNAPNNYTIRMRPTDCGSPVPLLKLWLSTTSSDEVLERSNSATFSMTAKSGDSITMVTKRKSTASPGISGSAELSFNGKAFNVSLDHPIQTTIQMLQSSNLGTVAVDHEGDCSNFAYRIEWTEARGEVPLIQVINDNTRGNDASCSVSEREKGGMVHDPITGDYLATAETQSQVVLSINGIPAKCTGNCSYEYSASKTPQVTSVAPSTGSEGADVIIGGSGFSTVKEDIQVMIGPAPCTVNTVTANEINCTVGEGGGTQNVSVTVKSAGTASGNFQFTYNARIDSVQPTNGSRAGGTNLNITGAGFSSTATVLVGGSPCSNISCTPSTITCVSPAQSGNTGRRKRSTQVAASVKVTAGSTTVTASTSFNYSSALTPNVTSVTPQSSSVLGGGILTLAGNGFGTYVSNATVTIDGKDATVKTCEDRNITAEIPKLPPGNATIKVHIKSKGNADTSAIGPLLVELKVTDVSPLRVALYGGANLTITGKGFGNNASELNCTVGEHKCAILPETLTDTRVICQIQRATATHVVTNQGSLPGIGKGYMWSKPLLAVNTEDLVRWEWAPSSGMAGYVYYGVREVQNASATETLTTGFDSGASSSSGSFTYRLRTAGTRHYWSGIVNTGSSISLRGSLHASQRTSFTEKFSLVLGGYEAPIQKATPTTTNNNPCPALAVPASCPNPAQPTTEFHIAFQSCMKPTITAMSRTKGHSGQDLEFTGSGFGNQNCQNIIAVGNYSCQVTSSSSTKVKCRIQTENTMEVGKKNDISFIVGDRGYAGNELDDDQYTLLPAVNSVSPKKVSKLGGSNLTISGDGFRPNKTSVKIGSKECKIKEVAYTRIKCVIPEGDGFKAEAVNVSVANPNETMAVCTNILDPCSVTYSKAHTPEITAITPAAISSLQPAFTISGSRFGNDASNVQVEIGNTHCTISAVDDDEITCQAQSSIPVGTHKVGVLILNAGNASGDFQVTSEAKLTAVSPSCSSIYGGTNITVSGNGFVNGKTEVKVGGNDCQILSMTPTNIVCSTPAGTSGSQDVTVTSNSHTYTNNPSIDYDDSCTPTVQSISPSTGKPGDTLVVNGNNFAADATVMVADVPCGVTAASTTQISCTLGDRSAGDTETVVIVPRKGKSNATPFTYSLGLSQISASEGSHGGGQNLTITGHGFNTTKTAVSICNKIAKNSSLTRTQLVVETPPSGGSGDISCDVAVEANDKVETLTGAFTYKSGLTPTVTAVSPTLISVSGGTNVTITGTGFGSVLSAVTVSIGGVSCTIQSITNNQLVVATRPGSGLKVNGLTVTVASKGSATQGSFTFSFIYVWSNNATWGNGKPTKGSLAVIPVNRTVYLDEDTPVLSVLLIEGNLIFADKNIILNAKIILINNGGRLQIGTETQPFQYLATIMLHGTRADPEIPIYGNKVLAVRNGVLDLQGKPQVPWTVLAKTAMPNETVLQLDFEVDWPVGALIVIATTGDSNSQKESEKHEIKAVSGKNITLTKPLKYTHISLNETYGNREVRMAAEVGLLSRNIKIIGSDDSQWHDKIEACPDGFDPGEFATQTCFQGRFGEESGSDMYGAHVIAHHENGTNKVKMSNVEITNAGQSFKLGRYPIHFHLNGDLTGSYVRSCSVHRAFNRAINIHGSHNAVIQNNVVYDVMGGAIFLEDGIETNNTLRHNLAVFVRSSSSLKNDDITPAAFWATNPSNIIEHNHAVGGTHFAFWYSMHKHPQGPSNTDQVCPIKKALGSFNNNTAHSCGWFGLWIFPEYDPRKNGDCSSDADLGLAVFENLNAYHNEKGAEFVGIGNVNLRNSVLLSNGEAGLEVKSVPAKTVRDEFGTDNCSYVAQSNGLYEAHKSPPTKAAVVLPHGIQFAVTLNDFYGFNGASSAVFKTAKIDGTCTDRCGGFQYQLKGNTFYNSSTIIAYEHPEEAVLMDLDGSLPNSTTNGTIVPWTPYLPPVSCKNASTFYNGSLPAAICNKTVQFIRVAINDISPSGLEGKDLVKSSKHGSSSSPFRKKRITNPMGWMVLLLTDTESNLVFENAGPIGNISMNMRVDGLVRGKYAILCFPIASRPDKFEMNSTHAPNESSTTLSETSHHGDWKYDDNNHKLCFVVSGNSPPETTADGKIATNDETRFLNIHAYRCFYPNCESPPDPNTQEANCTRPKVFMRWSNSTIWTRKSDGYVHAEINGTGGYGLPQPGDKVMIDKGTHVLVDEANIVVFEIRIEGYLEIDNDTIVAYRIELYFVYILGGTFTMGCNETQRLHRDVQLIIKGNETTPSYKADGGPEVGAKAIAVFGNLLIYGKPRQLTWTTLNETAVAGSQSIKLNDPVDWKTGDEIIITTTSNAHLEGEKRKIQQISSDSKTLTLDKPLQHKHEGHSETINGKEFSVRAEVGLLTHNIKIIGENYTNMEQLGFGFRIIVSTVGGFSGKARIESAEMINCGQMGFTEPYDPRMCVVFLGLGDNPDGTKNYIKSSSVFGAFNGAFGVYNTNDTTLQNLVVHGTVSIGIAIQAENTRVIKCLIAWIRYSGTYANRREPYNFEYEGAFQAMLAVNLILQENAVAGSERMCFHVLLPSCDKQVAWYNNTGRNCLIGVGILPDDPVGQSCGLIFGFHIFRCYDFGIYINGPMNLKIQKVVLGENGVGIFALLIGASSLEHKRDRSFTNITDSLVVGTRWADPDDNPSQLVLYYSGLGRSFRNGTHGKIGIALVTYTSGSNSAPTMGFIAIHMYNIVDGITYIYGVSFAYFDSMSSIEKARSDVVLGANPSNDDANHPVHIWDIKMKNVSKDSKVHLKPPGVGTINSADCIDMTCDGLRQIMIRVDDTFASTNTTLLSKAEYQWDGDRRYGLGDYRLPKELLTKPDGTRLDASQICSNKGIVREDTCTYNAAWNAYSCTDLTYKFLVIESMDADTEIRRLSPIAIQTKNSAGATFCDLLNGPQDHGWCSGYTCRKRLSTFLVVVAMGRTVNVHMTATEPQHVRFSLLNAAPADSFILSMYYTNPNRIDVKRNGDNVTPNNAENVDGDTVYRDETSPGQYTPSLSGQCGSNFYDRESKMQIFKICGGDIYDLALRPMIVVSINIPPMSIDDFFRKNLALNLALFLGIPANKITSFGNPNSSRRKRSTDTSTVLYFEIGNQACTSAGCTNTTVLSYGDQQRIASELINLYQLGNISDILNVTVNGMSVKEAIPPSTDPAWAVVANQSEDATLVLLIPSVLSIYQTPVGDTEGNNFSVQPQLQMLDNQGDPVTVLGATSSPWQVTATVRAGSGSNTYAELIGTTVVSYENGWANFTDLGISLAGTGYMVDFIITDPDGANFNASAGPITITERLVKAGVVSVSDDVFEGGQHEVVLDIRDNATGQAIDNIGWSNLDWYANVTLVTGTTYTGSLSGITTVAFSPVTGRATFSDISLDQVGMAVLDFTVYSDPSRYVLSIQKGAILYPADLSLVTIDTTYQVTCIFDLDFYEFGKEDFLAMFINSFQIGNADVKLSDASITEGSVIISMTVSGNSTTADDFLSTLCNSITAGSSFTYNGNSYTLAQSMTVNGVNYYTSNCVTTSTTDVQSTSDQSTDYTADTNMTTTDDSDTDSDSKEEESPEGKGIVAVVVGICVGVLILTVVVGGIVIWKLKVQPKTKTHRHNSQVASHYAESNSDVTYLGKGAFFFKDAFYREDTFNSLRSEKSFFEDSQCAPANTVYSKKGAMAFSSHY